MYSFIPSNTCYFGHPSSIALPKSLNLWSAKFPIFQSLLWMFPSFLCSGLLVWNVTSVVPCLSLPDSRLMQAIAYSRAPVKFLVNTSDLLTKPCSCSLSSLVSFHPLGRLSQILLLSWLLSSSYCLYQMCQKTLQDLPPNMSRINWSHHLYQYHHRHGVELRHLLPASLQSLNRSPCFNSCPAIIIFSTQKPEWAFCSELSSGSSCHPRSKSESLQWLAKPSVTWPLKTVISSLSYLSLLSGLPPHCSPSWASNTLDTLLLQGLLA